MLCVDIWIKPSKKAYSSTEVMVSGSISSSKLKQFIKAQLPIEIRLYGIVIFLT